MSESEIKVSDKRIFTADGRLREEFAFLDEAGEAPRAAPEGAPAERPAPAPREPELLPPTIHPGPAVRTAPQAPLLDPAVSGLHAEAPSFFDLLALLAEPASVYLGEVTLPGGESALDLDLARFHIDLIAVLQQKTAGNLTAEEGAVLEDLVYQLRMRYVQQRG